MPFENLKKHREFLEENEVNLEYFYFIFESSKSLPKKLIIDNYFTVYPIKSIDPSSLTHKLAQPLNELIQNLSGVRPHNGKYYYIIVGQLIFPQDPHEIQSVSFSHIDIIRDLLNIMSLYFMSSCYLLTDSQSIPFSVMGLSPKKLIKKELNDIELTIASQDLSQNVKNICSLRMEQFYLLQKSLSTYNLSIFSSYYDLSIAFTLLVTTIETFAGKYSNIKTNWDELQDEGMYKDIWSFINNSLNLSGELKEKLFNQLGEILMNHLYRDKGKFIDFILQFIPSDYFCLNDSNDKAIRALFGDLYDLRSRFLHEGRLFPIFSRDKNFTYNVPRDRRGKLKTYDKGTKIDVKELPSFDWFLNCFTGTIQNFIYYLYHIKEDSTDQERYTPFDKRARGVVNANVTRQIRPGEVLLKQDIYQKEGDYIRLQQRHLELKRAKKEEDFDKCVEILEAFINNMINTPEPKDTIKLSQCYTQLGVIYSKQGHYDDAIQMILKSQELNRNSDNPSLIAQDYYNLACFFCLKGGYEECLRNLKLAIEFYPGYKEFAKQDSDFNNLKDDSKFSETIS